MNKKSYDISTCNKNSPATFGLVLHFLCMFFEIVVGLEMLVKLVNPS